MRAKLEAIEKLSADMSRAPMLARMAYVAPILAGLFGLLRDIITTLEGVQHGNSGKE